VSAQNFDIVIAGGGMVGAALACALGDSSLSVALVEGTSLERIRPTAALDLRVSAISRASQRIIEAVGAWQRIPGKRVGPFRQMEVWDATGNGAIQFDSAALGEPSLGWIIENRVLQTALLEQAQTFSNITLLCPAALTMADVLESGLQLRLEDGRELRTRLLVGADGAQSQVRQWASINVDGWNYAQKAVVTVVDTAQPHQENARQRFLPTGPLAFLPLHDGRCGIVWSTLPERAEYLLSLDEDSFALELAEAFEWRLGKVTDVGPRASFPLRLQHAQAYVKPHFALIGDAAHVVHPLAGQGVNLGLLDAAALAEVLLEAAAQRRNIGSLKTLRRYERWRKGENALMLGALDGCKRLFDSPLSPVQWLRNTGLNMTDTLTPLKNLLARRAMGLAGDLPKLAKGYR